MSQECKPCTGNQAKFEIIKISRDRAISEGNKQAKEKGDKSFVIGVKECEEKPRYSFRGIGDNIDDLTKVEYMFVV